MRTRPPVATANSPDDVEAALYEALQRGDIEALMAVWADDDEIVCVHRLHYQDSALHHLVEKVTVAGPEGQQTAWVITTNLYVKTGLGWRLASHHASPGLLQQPNAGTGAERGEWPSTLH